MHKKYGFLFPGQGAQYPGMAKDFYDQFSVARRTFEEADQLLSQNLSKLIFEGPDQELTLTKNSQLAIYIASIAIYRVVAETLPILQPACCAGLSLGEYTALTVAGKIDFQEGLSLVKLRAELMQKACERHPGTMQVILGMQAARVEELIASLTPSCPVWVANINCPGQVVIAGTPAGVATGVELLLSQGAKRALPLNVSGAFHSGLMQEVEDLLAPYIHEMQFAKTPVKMVMNLPGDYVDDPEQMKSFLISQVTGTVRWQQGIEAMQRAGIEHFIEMGCGKTLAGMNKRIGVSAPTQSIETVLDLQAWEKTIEVICNC